jgi:3-hydroxy-9,10-secoandrosta-1,3,5(10)-triene-9,17-dione monooxygenase
MTATTEITTAHVLSSSSHDQLVLRATDLIPLIRENAAQSETDGRIAERTITAIDQAQLYRLAMPRRWGGHEAGFRTFMAVCTELGRGDGATAWTTAIMNVSSWLIGLYPEQAQRDVWGADPNARACAVTAPGSRSRRVEGGLAISGQWSFASGCLHSQWALLGTPIVNQAGTQVDEGLALVPMADLAIKHTWQVVGMRGTGSNTIVADDVFVPGHRILSASQALEGRYATEYTDETLYRSAFVPALALILVAPQVGMAKAAFELVEASLAKGRGISYTTYEQSRTAPTTQVQIAEAAQLIDTAWLHMMRAADDIDRFAASPTYMDRLTRARVRMDTGYTARRCREAIDILLSVQGAGSFASSSALQRIWRDQEVGSRHAVVSPIVNAELYGRELLGVQPQITPLI